jgi:DNA-binding response OmpR family regulator
VDGELTTTFIRLRNSKHEGNRLTLKSRILVVDDEPTIVQTACNLLRSSGFEALGVNSGDEAIAKAATFCPDVLLSDVTMPGMNGFETALAVKKLCPGCRLLFFSGHPDAAVMVEGLRAIGHRFELLEKPLDPAVLVEKIKTELGGNEKRPNSGGAPDR